MKKAHCWWKLNFNYTFDLSLMQFNCTKCLAQIFFKFIYKKLNLCFSGKIHLSSAIVLTMFKNNCWMIRTQLFSMLLQIPSICLLRLVVISATVLTNMAAFWPLFFCCSLLSMTLKLNLDWLSWQRLIQEFDKTE